MADLPNTDGIPAVPDPPSPPELPEEISDGAGVFMDEEEQEIPEPKKSPKQLTKDFVKSLGEKAKAKVKEEITALKNQAIAMAKGVINAVKAVVDSIVSAVKNIATSIGKLKNQIKDNVKQLKNKPKLKGHKSKKRKNKVVSAAISYGNKEIEPLSKAGKIQIIYHSLKGDRSIWPDSYDIEITESIDQLCRYGRFTVNDAYGTREFSNIINTLEGETFEIVLKNALEQEEYRSIHFGIYDYTEESVEANSFNTGLRKCSYDIIEEPYYNFYNSKTYGDYFEGKDPNFPATSSKMMLYLLSNYLLDKDSGNRTWLYNIEKESPKFPSFIIPNWTVKETFNYLKHFSDGGQLKMFNVSFEDETCTIIAPLENLMTNKNLLNKEYGIPKIVPSSTLKLENALPLGPFMIYGPNQKCIRNAMSGQTIMSFSYFHGKEKKQPPLKSFAGNMYAQYDYTKGEFFNDMKDNSYGTILSGNYENGAKIATNLGNYLLFNKENRSNQDHDIQIDSMEKPLIQTKLRNNFYEAYYNQIMLYTIVPGNSGYQVGMIYDISIPSVNQTEGQLGQNDETLSGKWLLHKMIHKISLTGKGPDTKYVMHCYFVKTGFEWASDASQRKKV